MEISKKYLIYTSIVFLLIGNSNISFSQVDTEFWFVVPELSYRDDVGGTPGTLRLATLELPATVTISMPANPYHPTFNPNGFQDIVVDIPANSSTAVDLTSLLDVAANPTNVRLENKPLNATGINNFGLHITGTTLFTAYWEVNYQYGSDLWTLKGKNALGTLFYTPFQTVVPNRSFLPARAYSAIDICATVDGTHVTITLPPGKAASYGSPFTTIPAGGTYSLTLDEGQTFSLFPAAYSVAAADRLAGTKIESDEDICVTLKDDALATPPQGADVIGDQIVPVSIVGYNYIVPDMGNPNHVYVLATENNTSIFVTDGSGIPIGPTPYVTLQQGQQALVDVPTGSKFAYITSNDASKTFYVFQLGIENQNRGGALVPAIGCSGNTQLSFTRARAGEQRFQFFIIVQKGNEDKFVLDGVPQTDTDVIKPGAFTEIPGTGGYMAFFSNSIPASTVSIGQHLVENTGDIFHLGIFNGFPSPQKGALYYGYYSDFGGLNIGANVAGTFSDVVRACYGDDVQLYAYGGTNYLWTPDTYLDDATSNLPTAINLPPGPHDYQVYVSGACAEGIIPLTILVAEPVVAFFKTNVTSGCSPLEIHFTDQSSGVYSWQYEMGDTLIKYDLNPATPYGEPPDPFTLVYTYRNTTSAPIIDTVTLMVKNQSGCADIFTKTIVVFPEIQSEFSISGTGADRGCDPLFVQFENTSSGDTASWYWDFGDGGSSIDTNPQHTFRNLFGPDSITYQTRLIAISPNYCRDTSDINITVYPYIEANFVFDTVFACTPHTIVISDQSFGADTYYWDFGDGSPVSSDPGPTIIHTYTNNLAVPDTFTIRLRVENKEGCYDEIARDVIVFPEIAASFTPSVIEGCSPFAVTFTNNSTGAATYYWDFGDGGTSDEIEPVHLYERNMMDHDTTYRVRLVTTSAEFCRDTAWVDILVHPYIEAIFAVNDIIGCHPFTITINNMSIGANQYIWDFGDGTPVSSTSASTFDHTYLNPGSSTAFYPLQLIVLNDEGCSDTLSTIITVHPEITANFTVSAFEGCHPLYVRFTDLSDNAILYYWEFGDGASSVVPEPDHTFTNFGTSDTTYIVKLTTSTADGECIMSVEWPVTVHPQMTAGFTLSEVEGCNPMVVTVENTSLGGSSFYWTFGDMTDTTTNNLDPFTHTFVNNDFISPRQFDVVLVANNPEGCYDTVSRSLTVFPDIQTLFSVSDTVGCHPLTVDFTNLTNGGHHYLWDYGDGNTSALFEQPHTFTNTGTADSVYTVTLTAFSANYECQDSYSIDITIHPYVQANFTVPDYLDCNPFDVTIYNSSVNASIYRWNFGDLTDTITYTTDPLIHRYYNTDYTNQQDYEIILVAENFAGCTSEKRRTITVEPAITASFTAIPAEGCNPLTVNFTNTSGGAKYYLWDFGDGTTSDQANLSHIYTNTGTSDTTYTVWLYATAPNHTCRDSSSVTVVVHPYIKADFTFESNIECSPFTITFNNASSGGSTFYWDFGDLADTTTTDMNPVTHTFYNSSFTDTAVFNVTMTAGNVALCPSQITRRVEVYPAVQALFSADITEGCHPLRVNFTNLSSGGYTYSWDFGDGSTSNADFTSHTFTNFTDSVIIRTVRLTATSRYNCTNELTGEITIYPKPKARFETDKIVDCPPFNVLITNTSLNADQYRWNFGDGEVLDTISADPLNHIYINNTTNIIPYSIKLTAITNYGCTDSSVQNINVYPATTAAFTFNDEGCHPMTSYFTNQSILGESFLWDFGDGSTITQKDPTHTYFNFEDTDTGYVITLTSTSRYGCVDSFNDTVFVYPQPVAEFVALPTHQVYPSATVSLDNITNDGPWTFLWDLDDGTTSSLETPDPHTYSTWGEYDIWLYVSSSHCYDSVSHMIRIFPGPPIASFDTIIPGCEPLTVKFSNTSLYGDTYLWEFDDGTPGSTEFEPVHTFTEDGIYNVKLTVTGEGGRDYAYKQVVVYGKPLVNFSVSPALVMLPDQEIQLYNLSEEGIAYLWNFGDGGTSTEVNPSYLYSDVGTYDISLDVWTEHGCTDRLVKPDAVEVIGKGLIVFPNAFEPDLSGPNGGYYSLNEPELNTVFHPHWEGVKNYRLEIYDRWGTLLYVSEDVLKGWDGYYQNKVSPQGVYVWKCTGTFSNGLPFTMVGDVTLLHHQR